MKIKVKEIYWTLGAFDDAIIFDAPVEESATAAMLHLGSLGDVQTTTLRAFNAVEMGQILAKLSK